MKKCRAEPLSRHDRVRLADLNYRLTMPLSLTSEWLPRFRQASGRHAAICFRADNTIYQAPWNCYLLNARKGWAPGPQCHWDWDHWQQMEQAQGWRLDWDQWPSGSRGSWRWAGVSSPCQCRENLHTQGCGSVSALSPKRWRAMTSEEHRQGCSWLPWALGLHLEQQNPSWDILGVRDVSGHSWVRQQQALLAEGID